MQILPIGGCIASKLSKLSSSRTYVASESNAFKFPHDTKGTIQFVLCSSFKYKSVEIFGLKPLGKEKFSQTTNASIKLNHKQI